VPIEAVIFGFIGTLTNVRGYSLEASKHLKDEVAQGHCEGRFQD